MQLREELDMFRKLCAIVRENRRLVEVNTKLQSMNSVLERDLIISKSASEAAQLEINRINNTRLAVSPTITDLTPMCIHKLEERAREGLENLDHSILAAERDLSNAPQTKQYNEDRVRKLEEQYKKLPVVSSCRHSRRTRYWRSSYDY